MACDFETVKRKRNIVTNDDEQVPVPSCNSLATGKNKRAVCIAREVAKTGSARRRRSCKLRGSHVREQPNHGAAEGEEE